MSKRAGTLCNAPALQVGGGVLEPIVAPEELIVDEHRRLVLDQDGRRGRFVRPECRCELPLGTLGRSGRGVGRLLDRQLGGLWRRRLPRRSRDPRQGSADLSECAADPAARPTTDCVISHRLGVRVRQPQTQERAGRLRARGPSTVSRARLPRCVPGSSASRHRRVTTRRQARHAPLTQGLRLIGSLGIRVHASSRPFWTCNSPPTGTLTSTGAQPLRGAYRHSLGLPRSISIPHARYPAWRGCYATALSRARRPMGTRKAGSAACLWSSTVGDMAVGEHDRDQLRTSPSAPSWPSRYERGYGRSPPRSRGPWRCQSWCARAQPS